MARHRRALSLALASAGMACGEASPPVVASVPAAPVSTDPVVVAPLDAGAPARPRARLSECVPLVTGEVSDDDAPALHGTGARTPVLAWFEARGVPTATASRWYAQRVGSPASTSTECSTLKVGDNAEEALVCSESPTSPPSYSASRAVAVVVRRKTPVVVLDVGLVLRSLDNPETRHLDLAVAFAADGRKVVVADRAPDGAVLVEAPSVCRQREKFLDRCERALQAGQPGAGCPFANDPDGTRRLQRESVIDGMRTGYPATLHDCAGGRAAMAQALKDADRSSAVEMRGALAFIDKACRDRGEYEWRGDRFVWTR